MARLWVKKDSGCWDFMILERAQAPIPLRFDIAADGGELDPRRVAGILQPFGGDSAAAWLLFVTAGVCCWQNGTSRRSGCAVLRDKDEVVLREPPADQCLRCFLSLQTLPQVAEYQGPPAQCPRCKTLMEPHSPSVECPACGVWHHQTDTQPCWQYADFCAACHREPTNRTVDETWTPKEL